MDRNGLSAGRESDTEESLSARRAWIEINDSLDDILAGVVALRKESVDRNLILPLSGALCCRRSPQGERG